MGWELLAIAYGKSSGIIISSRALFGCFYDRIKNMFSCIQLNQKIETVVKGFYSRCY